MNNMQTINKVMGLCLALSRPNHTISNGQIVQLKTLWNILTPFGKQFIHEWGMRNNINVPEFLDNNHLGA